MARKLTQRELRNNSGEIMRALDRGEEFTVTRNGRPVGELRPARPRQSVRTETLLAALRGTGKVDAKKFREDVNAVLDQDPMPRVWRQR